MLLATNFYLKKCRKIEKIISLHLNPQSRDNQLALKIKDILLEESDKLKLSNSLVPRSKSN